MNKRRGKKREERKNKKLTRSCPPMTPRMAVSLTSFSVTPRQTIEEKTKYSPQLKFTIRQEEDQISNSVESKT
jgi:hypothetical protein